MMRRNKYNARKTEVDGYTFDSQAEARRYGELKLLLYAGAISELEIHPKFEIVPAFTWRGKKIRRATYTADFQYIENGETVVEDVKGGRATQTQAFRLRAKLFKWRYPDIDFRIVEA